MFVISSYATLEPMGPISALVGTQTILVVIVTAIRELQMPSAMELIRLVLGLFGAMLLTIPDELYAFWYRMTRCKPYVRPVVAPTKDLSQSEL